MMARLLFRRMDDTYKRTHFWWRHSAEFTRNSRTMIWTTPTSYWSLKMMLERRRLRPALIWDVRIERIWVWLKLIEHQKWMNTHEIQMIKSVDTCFFWFETYLFDPTWLVDKWWVHPRKACQQKQFVKQVCLPACVCNISESRGLIHLQTYRCLVL